MERHEILSMVVEAIAEAEGCRPADLEYTLYEHVDPEAILTLVASEHSDWELRFTVPSHEVAVRGDGRIFVDGTERRELDPASQTTD